MRNTRKNAPQSSRHAGVISKPQHSRVKQRRWLQFQCVSDLDDVHYGKAVFAAFNDSYLASTMVEHRDTQGVTGRCYKTIAFSDQINLSC